MKSNKFLLPLALLLSIMLLASCGGKTEDVRISLCRNLSTSLLDLQQTPEWNSLDTHIKRPAYARISLDFTAQKNAGAKGFKAACYYEYEAVEEDVITHTDPLSAYATLPYKMTLNGKNVPKRVINIAVNAIVKQKGGELMRKAQMEFSKVMTGVIQEF